MRAGQSAPPPPNHSGRSSAGQTNMEHGTKQKKASHDPKPMGAKAQNQEALSLALTGRTGRTEYEPNGTMHWCSGHMWN